MHNFLYAWQIWFQIKMQAASLKLITTVLFNWIVLHSAPNFSVCNSYRTGGAEQKPDRKCVELAIIDDTIWDAAILYSLAQESEWNTWKKLAENNNPKVKSL